MCFDLLGCSEADGGVKPFLVVDDLDKPFDVAVRIREARVLVDVDLLDLQGFHE